MGGKSRKTGQISRKLIDKIKKGKLSSDKSNKKAKDKKPTDDAFGLLK
jgi:hypothetical protein